MLRRATGVSLDPSILRAMGPEGATSRAGLPSVERTKRAATACLPRSRGFDSVPPRFHFAGRVPTNARARRTHSQVGLVARQLYSITNWLRKLVEVAGLARFCPGQRCQREEFHSPQPDNR